MASRNSSNTESIQPSWLQAPSPPNLQPELSVGHASGAAGRAAIYQQLFKCIRPQARGRAEGFSAMTKVDCSCRTGLAAGACTALWGLCALQARALHGAFSQAFRRGEPGCRYTFGLGRERCCWPWDGLVGTAMQQARRHGERDPRRVWETI